MFRAIAIIHALYLVMVVAKDDFKKRVFPTLLQERAPEVDRQLPRKVQGYIYFAFLSVLLQVSSSHSRPHTIDDSKLRERPLS